MSKWLEFEKNERAQGKKTDTWVVVNKVTGKAIGAIFWYGGFRKYVFQSNHGIIMDAGCMADVSDFLTQIMEEWKLRNKLRK